MQQHYLQLGIKCTHVREIQNQVYGKSKNQFAP